MCLNFWNIIFTKFEILQPFAYKLYVLEQKPSAYFFAPFEIYPKTLSIHKSDQWFNRGCHLENHLYHLKTTFSNYRIPQFLQFRL